LEQELTMDVKGRDLGSGLPKTLTIRSEEIREALQEPLSSILNPSASRWNAVRPNSPPT